MSIHSIKPIAFVISFTGLLGLLWVNIALLMGKPAPFGLSFTGIFGRNIKSGTGCTCVL